MIQSLNDAWEWYLAVRTLALDMRKLAGKWNDPALETVLGRDNRLRHRTKEELLDRAKMILDDLDDLAVLVLFSVFEANVRVRVSADVERETLSIRHPAVLRAVDDLKEAIENGSFGQVTEASTRYGSSAIGSPTVVRTRPRIGWNPRARSTGSGATLHGWRRLRRLRSCRCRRSSRPWPQHRRPIPPEKEPRRKNPQRSDWGLALAVGPP